MTDEKHIKARDYLNAIEQKVNILAREAVEELIDDYESRGDAVGMLVQENTDQRQTIALIHKASMRGIKMWQEKTGRDMVWPDHGDLCEWLLDEIDKRDEEIVQLKEAIDRMGGVTKK